MLTLRLWLATDWLIQSMKRLKSSSVVASRLRTFSVKRWSADREACLPTPIATKLLRSSKSRFQRLIAGSMSSVGLPSVRR